MGEATVLLLFRSAAGVSNADVRGHDDIGCARVSGWVVEVDGKRWAVVELPERDSSGGGIVFEDFDAGVGIGGALQPEERGGIFRWAEGRGGVGGGLEWGVNSIAG